MSNDLSEAVKAFEEHNYQKAFDISGKIVEFFPRNAEAWYLMAKSCIVSNENENTLYYIERAIDADLNEAKYYILAGNFHKEMGSYEKALENANIAFDLNPTEINLLEEIAKLYIDLNIFSKAIFLYENKIEKNNDLDYHINLSFCYLNLNNFEVAEKHAEKALGISPENETARTNLILIFIGQGKLEEAKALSIKLLTETNNTKYENFLGRIYYLQNDFEKSITAYKSSLEKESNNIETLHQIATVYAHSDKFDLSEEYIQKAFDLQPENPIIAKHLFITLIKLGRKEKIDECLNKTYLEKHEPLLYYECRKIVDGDLSEDDKNIVLNLSNIQKNPEDYHSISQLIKLYIIKKKYTELLPLFNIYLSKYPEDLEIASLYIFTKANLCEWNYLSDVEHVKEIFMQRHKDNPHTLISPFCFYYIKGIDEFTTLISKDRAYFTNQNKSRNFTYQESEKIKIGYISCDFTYHSVGMLIRDIFKCHNLDKFEIFIFDTNIDDNSSIKNTIKDSVKNFYSLHEMNNQEAAKFINEKGINILVDLSGYTGKARPEILAYKPAPIQAHMIGEACSLYSDFIDYFFADNFLIDSENRNLFQESIVYLPNAYATPPFEEVDIKRKKEEYKLPNDKFIFCCFCRAYRIESEIFTAWMEILKEAPDSVLWLRADHPELIPQIIKLAKKFGIHSSRLYFTDEWSISESWQILHADLWLDTYTVSSGTSSFLSLWANFPVLTIKGKTLQMRVSANLNHHHGIDELVTNSLDEYKEKALYYYNNKQQLKKIKEKMNSCKENSPLFDPKRYIQHLEKAYIKMTENYNEKTTKDIVIEE